MYPIVINFKDLVNNINTKKLNFFIEKAFGKNSLGLILIKNIPELQHLRKQFLQTGRKFVKLQNKSDYEVEKAIYAVGWSHGKEKMKDNKPDFAKGSYYANPLEDNPAKNNKDLIDKFPGSYHPNVWPKEIPEFEILFKKLGELIYNIGLIILKNCDNYMAEQGYKTNMEELMINSKTCKGRFLHYFPSKSEVNEEDDGFCGWHCDSGCLTGLISAMYFNDKDEEIKKPDNCGLSIKDRNNNLVKITIPENCVAFQIGEIIQILSYGELIATPHCVKSTKEENITRNTLAIFMDVDPMYSINIKSDNMKEILEIRNLPKGVPKMKDRFYNGITYGEFLNNTYKAYYK
jgi:isopenicillin N synthase-like dioxygenase